MLAGLAVFAMSPVADPLQARGGSGATVSTIEYARSPVAGGSALKPMLMDLYLPKACRRLCPVLVAMHGGSFLTGARDIDEQREYGMLLAERGIAVASISYRLERDEPVPSDYFRAYTRIVPGSTYAGTVRAFATRGQRFADTVAAAIEDETRAVDWLRSNGASLGLDPGQIGLMGASAGAEAVLDLAYLSDDLGVRPPPIGLVVSIRGTIQDNRATGMSPAIRSGDPPLFILHGTADTTVPYGEAERLYHLAAAAKVPVEIHPILGWNHELGGRTALEMTLSDRRTVADALVRFVKVAFARRLPAGYARCTGAGAPCPKATP